MGGKNYDREKKALRILGVTWRDVLDWIAKKRLRKDRIQDGSSLLAYTPMAPWSRILNRSRAIKTLTFREERAKQKVNRISDQLEMLKIRTTTFGRYELAQNTLF